MNDDELNYYYANVAFNKSLDSLCHHGVKGMKWGVRNEATLRKYNGVGVRRGIVSRIKRRQQLNRLRKTASKRASVVQKSVEKAEQKTSPISEIMKQHQEANGGHRIQEKNPKKLSDTDLRAANQRLQDEITYKQRQNQLQELNMSKRQRRNQAIKKNASEVGKTVLKNFATTQLTKAMNSKFGINTATAAKAKEKVNKSTEKTKERIIESVYNVTYNTQVNSYYPSSNKESKPVDVSSKSSTVKTRKTFENRSFDDKKKTS